MAFTPIDAVAGGLVIGLAVFWNARLNGKVTGISGALYTSLMGDSLSFAFITGLISGGIILKRVYKHALNSDPLLFMPHERVLLAGWLVGIGTSFANGCTSGHGVCGLSRLSPRSLVAVITFFSSALQTATTFHSSGFFPTPKDSEPLSFSNVQLPAPDRLIFTAIVLIAAIVLPLCLMKLAQSFKEDQNRIVREVILYVLGMVFAAGLIICEMTNPAKTLSFLDLSAKNWDPSMAFVFIGALPLGFLGFRPLRKGIHPTLVSSHSLPTNTDIDLKLVFGSALFGIGWGLLGLCPGPALVYVGAFPFSYKASAFGLSMACGSILSRAILKANERWVS